MTTVILFVLGTIVGSFLNVLALRYNSGVSLMGRSHCSSCGKTLGIVDLVPILSFFFLKGRCRSCQSRVSWQYPLVELWTALVFVTIFNPTISWLSNFLILLVFSLYITIVVYDIRHQVIPDGLVYASILVSFVFRFIEGGEGIDYLAGPILALIFALIWLLSRGRAMGFGDVKLVTSVGLLLGGAYGFSAIILAFWLGAGFGLGWLILTHLSPLFRRGKRITIKSAIPFAPFIVLGAWFGLIFQMDLLHVSLF